MLAARKLGFQKHEIDEMTEEHQYTEDIDKTFKADFKYPFENGTKVNSITVWRNQREVILK